MNSPVCAFVCARQKNNLEKHFLFGINFTIFAMKYNELERLLKKAGCRLCDEEGRHPTWYSSKTGKYFQTSHHKSEEVKPGTLKSILKDAGLK